MWETIRGYLTFTRKERFGVLFLLIIISVLFVLPYFFKASPGDPDPAAYEKMKMDLQKFEMRMTDSSRGASGKNERNPKPTDYHERGKAKNETAELHTSMFYFDPNKTDADGWRRLGISERLTQTILHYIEKGGHFQKADDLKKLYGLEPADYDRLSPYVRIALAATGFKSHAGYDAGSAGRASKSEKTDSFNHESASKKNLRLFSPKLYSMTDINLADSSTWARLPGIGEKLAARIVHFREKLGGFYQSEQVGETFGLPDSTFQKIKPYLVIHPVSLSRIDLNSASKEILQSHPYIRWQIAKNILDYRLQHGAYRSVDELLQLAAMDSLTFEKLKPYLILR